VPYNVTYLKSPKLSCNQKGSRNCIVAIGGTQEMYTREERSMRIFILSVKKTVNSRRIHTGKKRNKLHTSGPRIWVCSSSGLTDAGNLEHLRHQRPALPVRSLSSHVHYGPSPSLMTVTYLAQSILYSRHLPNVLSTWRRDIWQ
jgi:hypothetical protein